MRGDADLENQEELLEFCLKMVDRRKEKKNWYLALYSSTAIVKL